MTDLRGLGLRLMTATAGTGSVILAVVSDDLSTRLLAIAMALVFLGPLVILLLTDFGVRLDGGRSRERDPDGLPTAAEWVVAVFFDGVFVLMVCAGALAAPADSGKLLAAGLVCAVAGLLLTGQLVSRWWRNRHRPPR